MGKVQVSRSRSGLNIYMDASTAVSLGGMGRKVALQYSAGAQYLVLIQKEGARNSIAAHNNPQFPYRVTFTEHGSAKIPDEFFGPTLIEAVFGQDIETNEYYINMALPPIEKRGAPSKRVPRQPGSIATYKAGRGKLVVMQNPRERLKALVLELNTLLAQGHAEGIQWDWLHSDRGDTGNVDTVVKSLPMPGRLRGRIAETFE